MPAVKAAVAEAASRGLIPALAAVVVACGSHGGMSGREPGERLGRLRALLLPALKRHQLCPCSASAPAEMLRALCRALSSSTWGAEPAALFPAHELISSSCSKA